VSDTPEPGQPESTHAEGHLARLGTQVEQAQALLVRLLQDVVATEKRLELSRDGPLAEVNERLVVAALTSQAEAEAATRALKEAVQSAGLDTLTGLPNRSTLLDRLAQAIANAKRHGTRFALVFLDLDQFKPLNDSYGHRFGDRVLKLVAERLVAAVREVDTVSRHGGDEFLVLLAELAQPADAQVVAEKLVAAIGAPAEVEGHALGLTASVGVAIYPDDGHDIDTLIAHADAAMYANKRRRAGAAEGTGAGGALAPHDVPPVVSPASARNVATDAAAAERRLADLREANEKLVLVALGAQQLHEAAEQARQRQAAFLAAVAAELRNPAAPIRVAATMLGRASVDETLLPRVQHIVGQQMAQMSRLVEAVNLDSGSLLPGRRRVDMGHVIDAAVAAHKPAMERRRQRFERVLPPGPVVVMGDAARLEQVVSNLLDNASRYTHDGGRISLSVAVEAGTLTLTVDDNGIGITGQMLPHLFEPFVQDPRALGFNGVGIGIGLTVARALVRAHGGHIAAHSAGAGRGSRFVVTLPLAPSEPAAGTAR
jgi:diguanylate cyclase (GGDEF)-like protein